MKKCIAISACLMGEAVRYDGQCKKNHHIDVLSDIFLLRPFCPEVGVGMGVPRKPVQLVETKTGVRVLGVDEPAKDVTDLLTCYAENYNMDSVSGVIFKARSPSCGLGSTPVYDINNKYLRNGNGLFASRLKLHWPDIPMIEESDLEDKEKLKYFLQRVDEL